MHPIQDLFSKAFHMYYNLIYILICTPMWKKIILVKSGCYSVDHGGHRSRCNGSSCLPQDGCQLLWFVTMNLYGGGREIETMMLQGFLDRFRPPG
jgi:hypothetical protein